MNGNEAAQIIKNQDRLEEKVDKIHLLLVGNGNERAVLPRLRTLEFFMKVLKWLSPIFIALITAGVMWVIFGTP